MCRGGRHGPLAEPQLLALQALQEQQAQQEAEPLPLAGQGTGQEALQVPRVQEEPTNPRGVAVPLAVQHRFIMRSTGKPDQPDLLGALSQPWNDLLFEAI